VLRLQEGEEKEMKLFLYRTVDNDEDGDPYDWGAVQAAHRKDAIQRIKKRIRKLGLQFLYDFYLYEQKPLKGFGFLKRAQDRETIQVQG
jgi:hypothetical protein